VARSLIKTERPPHLRVVSGGAVAEPPLLGDDELIDAVERGDAEIAEALYDRLGGIVSATLLRVLGKRDVDHEDLVQMAFEQIFVSLARRRFGRACSLKSWAVSITTNIALNALRKRRTERRYVDNGLDSRQLEVAGRVGDAERATQVVALREELANLAPSTAEVVVLFEVMGCDLAEVAAATGLSVAAAQSRLVRGRAELRSRLSARQRQGTGLS
jgi:RNA polymerase sigma-70 factor (ECF subfamily)